MQYALLLAFSAACELLPTVRVFWRMRVFLSVVATLSLSAACAGLLAVQLNIWSILLLLIGLYRVFNLMRVLEGRMQEKYARRVVRRTTWWLIVAQGLMLVLLQSNWVISAENFIHILVLFQIVVALLLAWSMLRSLRTTSALGVHPKKLKINDRDLPSLTIAIPARNEDEQLEACLESILASDYPKLEIIALDDCSGDRTSDIIRQYAHDGVRFIRGSEPAEGWLAKNQAYDRLYKEASGALILFCGVDVRLQPSSARQLVTALIQRDKSMLSVLPLNPLEDMHLGHQAHLPVIQLMRYYWEMAPPRRLFNRPPVLSTVWLVSRQILEKSGGFASVKRSITPEAHFAKYATTVDDGYSFIRSDKTLGVSSHKPAADQISTSFQTRYPQLHKRPELVALTALAELALILAPFIQLGYAAVNHDLLLLSVSLATLILHGLTFQALWCAVFINHHRHAGLTGLLFLPAIITDIVLLHYSMYKYEFSEVFWKGRDVSAPVMRVYPRLPKID